MYMETSGKINKWQNIEFIWLESRLTNDYNRAKKVNRKSEINNPVGKKRVDVGIYTSFWLITPKPANTIGIRVCLWSMNNQISLPQLACLTQIESVRHKVTLENYWKPKCVFGGKSFILHFPLQITNTKLNHCIAFQFRYWKLRMQYQLMRTC